MSFKDRIAVLLEWEGVGKFVSESERMGNAGDKNLGKVDDRLARLGTRMQTTGAGMVAGATLVGGALHGMARNAEEAAAFARKLDQALESNRSFAEAGKQPFVDLATEIQNLTGVDGDAIIGMEGFLGTLGRTADETLNLTPLIVDLSKRFGLELEPAARLVNNAIEGSTGRLERMIGPMREGETVAAALARTVGGFAERDAQSFSGQIDIMKQKLGDLSEGIGVGVIDAFSGWIDIGSKAVDMLGGLDAGTQAGIGKFAAYATAATGVVGALSFVAGSVVKLKDRFTTLDIDSGTRSLNNFGKVAAGLGLVGAIAGLAAMGQEMGKLRVDVAGLSVGLDENARATADGLLALARWNDLGLKPLAEEIAGQSVPALERFRDVLAENAAEMGVSQDELAMLTDIIEDKRAADEQATIDQQNYTGSIQEGAEASGELEDQTEATTDAIERQTPALDAVTDALEAQGQAIQDNFGAQLSLEEANIRSRQALIDYNDVLADGESTALEREQAGLDLLEAFRNEGEAAKRAAETSARAAGDAENATRLGVEAQIRELQGLASTLEEGSPLRARLVAYIAELESIPQTLTTNIETVYSAPRGSVPAGQRPVERRAKGGPIRAGDPYLVGEEGPELLVPGHSGAIIPIKNWGGLGNLPRRAANGGPPGAQAVTDADQSAEDAAEEAEKAAERIEKAYDRIASAMGRSTADQLTAQDLSAEAWEQAAEAAELHSEKIENAYELGEVTADEYLAHLNEQLTGHEKYSDGYTAIVNKIRQVTEKQVKDLRDAQDREYADGKLSNERYIELLNERIAATEEGTDAQVDAFKKLSQALRDQIAEAEAATRPFRTAAENQKRDLERIFLEADRESKREGATETRDQIIARLMREREADLRLQLEAEAFAKERTGSGQEIVAADAARRDEVGRGPTGSANPLSVWYTPDPAEAGRAFAAAAASELARRLPAELLQRQRAS